MKFKVKLTSGKTGVFSTEVIKQMLGTNELSGDELASLPGAPDWVPLRDREEFKDCSPPATFAEPDLRHQSAEPKVEGVSPRQHPAPPPLPDANEPAPRSGAKREAIRPAFLALLGWFFLGLTALSVLYYFMHPVEANARPMNVTKLIGSNFFAGLALVFGIAILVHKQARATGFILLIASTVTIVVHTIQQVGLPGSATEVRATEDEALEEREASMNLALDEATPDDEQPRGTDQRVDAGAPRVGADAEFREVMKAVVNDNIAVKNRYIENLENAGWNRLLDLHRLREDDGAETLQIAEKAEQAFHDYMKDKIAQEQRRIGLVKASQLPQATKEAALRGFAKSSAEGAPLIKEGAEIERQIQSEFVGMATFLQERKDEWTIEDGEISPYTDAIALRYNQFVDRVSELTARQEKLKPKPVKTGR